MGLPLAAQFASHGWSVIAVDIDPSVVAAINDGRSHIGEEPGVAELVARRARGRAPPRDAGRRRGGARGRRRRAHRAGHARRRRRIPTTARWTPPSTAIAPGLHAGSTRHLRDDAAGRRHARTGTRRAWREAIRARRSRTTCSSRSRRSGCTAAPRSATSPPTRSSSAGSAPASTARAAAFYDSVLDAEVVAMSSAEAAEFAKLADTTYRDVNIALANEFARYADRIGVDVTEVIAAANSQPYSHIHQPGLGVGGHCIPVYPHFLLDRAPELELVALARRDQRRPGRRRPRRAGRGARRARGRDRPRPRADLPPRRQGAGLFAGAAADRRAARARRARPLAYDPLLTADEIGRTGATPWSWGAARRRACAAIVTQTADPAWLTLDPAWFPGLRAVRRRPELASRPGAARRRRVPRDRWSLAAQPVRILSVVGTRPQLIKAAALSPDLRARHDEIFVDTGQHYDEAMAGVFFTELGLPQARPLAWDRRRIARRADRRDADRARADLIAERPDAVLVYGDTNSTLAGALVAAKLHVPGRPCRGRACARSIGGCRRRSTGSSPTTSRAGCSPRRRRPSTTSPTKGSADGVELVGDLMQDLAARVAARRSATRHALASGPVDRLRLEPGGYLFATIHRAENRSPDAIRAWARCSRAVASAGSSGRPGAPSGHAVARSSNGRATRGRRSRHRAVRVSLVARAPAPRGGRPDRLRRRPARGRLARHAVPRPALDDRMGRASRGLRAAACRSSGSTRTAPFMNSRVGRPPTSPQLSRRRGHKRATSHQRERLALSSKDLSLEPGGTYVSSTHPDHNVPLRVVFLTHYYAPERGAPQTRLRETINGLREHQIESSVVTGPPHYPGGQILDGRFIARPRTDYIDGVPIHRLPMLPRPNDRITDRIIDQGTFATSAFLAARLVRRADAFVVESPPLFLGGTAALLRRLTGTPYLFHVADPWPDFPIEAGVLRGVPSSRQRCSSNRWHIATRQPSPPLHHRW